eukprot:TRINITY_DN56290_c0_g1_i1.p1 TRINITY_DN56290_c0_g1~~TRINITY_DN56290_c0_g1_i1.p1  ORF type:complete len:472 (+),score=81.02 TRINITY_DN56290_c0_g1_i1:48-1418(+)
MPHAGAGYGPSKGPSLAKKGAGGACHAPSKVVDDVPAESEPITISNSSANVMCPELFDACRAGKLERVRKLLAHEGVSGTATDYYGKTCFHSACLAGQVNVVEALLAELPALLWQNADDGTTPLMSACELGQVRVARLLVERKMNPHVGKADGTTALMRASECGGLECIEFLLREAKVDLNVKNEEGFTALLYAASNGRTAVVKALLEARADSSAKLVVGTSAFSLAEDGGHDSTVRALKMHAKLQARKGDKGRQDSANPVSSLPVNDDRPLDDLVAELQGGDVAVASSKKKKKKKCKEQLIACELASDAETSAIAIDVADVSLSQPVNEAAAVVVEETRREQTGMLATNLTVSWVMTCKLLGEDSVAQVDVAWMKTVKQIWSKTPGIIGIESSVCRKQWDYILIVKFEDQEALDAFLCSDVRRLELDPQMEQLREHFVGGMSGVRWRHFVSRKLL